MPAESEIMADRVEAGTLLMACGIAGGEIELVGTRLEHLEIVVSKLCEMGMRVSQTSDGLWAADRGTGSVRSTSRPFRTRVSRPTSCRSRSP